MRKLKGKIVSNKMDKTCVVDVERLKKHDKYSKYYKMNKKYKAHDENNEYKIGDEVIIEETNPISKDKRWKIIGYINPKK
jgi:small subunit ribosomal protein S17